MDGLTVSTSQDLLRSGDTLSEIQNRSMKSSLTPGANEITSSFGEALESSIMKVNEAQKLADSKMQELATGKSKNIPDVMIASEKADIAFKLMMSVRNKLIDAYQTITKMQV